MQVKKTTRKVKKLVEKLVETEVEEETVTFEMTKDDATLLRLVLGGSWGDDLEKLANMSGFAGLNRSLIDRTDWAKWRTSFIETYDDQLM